MPLWTLRKKSVLHAKRAENFANAMNIATADTEKQSVLGLLKQYLNIATKKTVLRKKILLNIATADSQKQSVAGAKRPENFAKVMNMAREARRNFLTY